MEVEKVAKNVRKKTSKYNKQSITQTFEGSDFQKDYNDLFKLVDSIVDESIKHKVKAECIFLTHNKEMHNHNIIHGTDGEKYIWRPDLQEPKTSEF